MSGPESVVAATTHAIDLIEKLKARFGPLMFVQSGGCCDGSSPMCFQDGDFMIGPNDLLLGEIDGCLYYVDDELFEQSGSPHLLIDCTPGETDPFSLEETLHMHFISRTQIVGPAQTTFRLIPSCLVTPSNSL